MHFENEIEHKILVTYVIAKVSDYLSCRIPNAVRANMKKPEHSSSGFKILAPRPGLEPGTCGL
ncbi:hypothetical protein, partial [Neisseria meningitidis]|uniref:hypothetical protein n=1 Tax=Neisseria meningitidis TaxID=487 RepID=UPI001E34E489